MHIGSIIMLFTTNHKEMGKTNHSHTIWLKQLNQLYFWSKDLNMNLPNTITFFVKICYFYKFKFMRAHDLKLTNGKILGYYKFYKITNVFFIL